MKPAGQSPKERSGNTGLWHTLDRGALLGELVALFVLSRGELKPAFLPGAALLVFLLTSGVAAVARRKLPERGSKQKLLYEDLEWTAQSGLIAVIVVESQMFDRFPHWVLPTAMLPFTVMSGAAAWVHHRLPKTEQVKPDVFRLRRHPMYWFVLVAAVNILLFSLCVLWR